jgi:hypothetical protein
MLTKEQYQAGDQHPEGEQHREQHPLDDEQHSPPPLPQFTVLSCYAFLAATVLSGNVVGWNLVFAFTTFWPYVAALGIMVFAYANYINCMVRKLASKK